MLSTRDYNFRAKDKHRLKVKGWKKIFYANGNRKKADHIKVVFKTKTTTKDKEKHYIMIKESIQEEYITLVNIYAPNIGAPKYIKQILTYLKVETDNDKIMAGDFCTPLTSTDKSFSQKITKETVALNAH